MFIAVSDYYKTFMSDYLGIPLDRIRVVPLGVSPEDLSPGGRTRLTSDPFTIGYLARVAPEKSLDLLAKAYRIFRKDRELGPARLEVAGYLAPEHRPYLQNIENQLREWGLENEFHYHGTLNREQKVSFLRSIDVLSVPSTYCEPKGLYLLEAMACGLPIVKKPNNYIVVKINKIKMIKYYFKEELNRNLCLFFILYFYRTSWPAASGWLTAHSQW